MYELSTYLTFKGNGEEAINFYQQALGGKLEIHRFKEMPEGDKLPAADQNKIMHASLILSNDQCLMISDAIDSMPECKYTLVAGNNFSIAINAHSQNDADKVFKALSTGGKVTMPLQKTFWNAYFGMLVDKFGVQWMVNHDLA